MATTEDLLSFLASLAEWMSAHQQHRSTIAGSNMKEFSVRIERSMLFSISVGGVFMRYKPSWGRRF
jgi:hypothetical protein